MSPSVSSKFPQAAIIAFFKRARAAGATTILNPAPATHVGPDLLDLVDILVLNETELGLLTRANFTRPTGLHASLKPPSLPADRKDHLRHTGQARLSRAGRGRPVDHCGARGESSGHHRRGRLLCRRACRPACQWKGIIDALEYANAAASICVQRMGARRRCRQRRRWRPHSLRVVPANAGIHNPGRKLIELAAATSL